MSYFNKQIGAAILTITVYTLLFHSVWTALLLAFGVGWHEYCHLMAARKMKMETKGFFLLPFIGGVAVVTGSYASYAEQAFIVLAGPMGGGALAVLSAIIYFILSHVFHLSVPWMAAAAYWMCYLNLFNLLPFSFMDGGQLMGTITYSKNRTLGVACLLSSTIIAIILLMMVAPILGLFIAVIGGSSVYGEMRNWNAWRQGKTWLCTSSWISPPQKLNNQEIYLTIGCWIISIIVLYITMYFLYQLAPDQTNFSYLFSR